MNPLRRALLHASRSVFDVKQKGTTNTSTSMNIRIIDREPWIVHTNNTLLLIFSLKRPDPDPDPGPKSTHDISHPGVSLTYALLPFLYVWFVVRISWIKAK